MRSYFAGLLCVDWSPDSQFVVVGGQDDLITVWSMQYRSVICRGEGHRSWVSTVRFDPYLCPPKCQLTDTRDFSPSTSANGFSSTQEQKPAYVEHNNTPINRFSLADDGCCNPMLGTYRIGSVGQDTQFCLWDLTEDVIRQGVQFVLNVAPTRPPNGVLDDSFFGTNFPSPVTVNPVHQTPESRLTTSPTSASTAKAVMASATLPSTPESVSNTGAKSGNSWFGFLTFNRKKLTPTASASTLTPKTSTSAYGSERIKANSLVHRFSTTVTHHRNAGDPGSEKRHGSDDAVSKYCSLGRLNDSSRLFEMNEQ
ncbi:unnamed protein product [Echinostoma caproni]|uniref:WD_REPEATS_REGION domain-containing protein n=1 Tax=Echinostoma caproni TaxID=27848 RepID=A0A183B1Y7_9TREM|nr:unnamed protein product [Echinostoma caproni]